MSGRFLRCVLFTVMVFSTSSVHADWLCRFFNSVARDTKRRNCWPKPFECPDRQFARAPFALQVANGWRRQNLLGDHHFESQNGLLTKAGKLKIRWILYEAPAQHRAIFVHIALTSEETAARLSTVHEYVAQIMPQGDPPPINTTTVSDDGWPADRVDLIGRKYQATTPAPRLPSAEGQNGSSDGT